MKKGKKIALGIVVILIGIVIFFTVWQWDNIKAIYMGITYSDEKIETKIVETKEKLAKELEKEGLIDKKVIEGFSKEDEEKIASGEISIEEAVDKLFSPEETDKTADNVSEETSDTTDSDSDVNNNSSTSKPEQSANNTESVPPTSDDKQNTKISETKKAIELAVKEMYTLKATYVQYLASIENYAKELYVQSEMTTERKLEIADLLMPRILESEKTCDAQVETILGNLKDKLTTLDGDTSVVQYIREQYFNEKQLQKSKYINKYL